jgi:hypothetical protein
MLNGATELKKRGLDKNTLVVVSGDNALQFRGKGTLYEFESLPAHHPLAGDRQSGRTAAN